MILLCMFTPFLGSLMSGFFGRYMGVNSSKWMVCLSMFVSVVSTYMLFMDVMFNEMEYTYNMMNWLNVEYLVVDWSFTIDKLSVSMLVPVVTVSFLVHLYSVSYMSHDPHQQRFFSYLSMFTFAMMVLVTGDNYLILFVGWEFIGVASYLLISFWFTRFNAVKSGLSALLMNRFGDALLVLGLSYLVTVTGSVNYNTVFALGSYLDVNMITVMLMCFLVASMAKSAQLGLHSWLLLAMEGPTPVSSLLHAACLVIAGVFLLMRSSPLLEYTPIVLLLILWLGGLSTLISGLMAMVSNDIKKMMALSTMSQVGMMMMAMGVSCYNLALFHLMCHSFFKALLFMSAGSVMHSMMSEYQDIRMYGGFRQFMPLAYTCMFMASLSLMAMPGLTGFYSKDMMIESMYGEYTFSGFIMYWFALMSATCTSLYSMRLMYYTFLNNPNSPKYIYINLKENDMVLITPMMILTILSMFGGYLLRDIYLGMGSPFNELFMHPNNLSLMETEFSLPSMLKVLPLMTGLGGGLILLLMYEFNYSLFLVYNNKNLSKLYSFFNQKIMFDQLLNNLILRSGLNMGWLLNVHMDRGMLQLFGPLGLWKLSTFISSKLNKLVFLNIGFILEIMVLSWLLIVFKVSLLKYITLLIMFIIL
ncbi:unnamed protein product (mitochondrion) [Komagataella phaffii CBS 7435]|uniref:NADH-ubiquinone oxidoreductase chain 5 n=1 Tax=Komagataella phaffii (strain ATCC 76273 / CBS 7435 / CECT 11047 / NRRL Y-11430 / Wegner 21-1) TaxID=981350 RepID=F2R0J9_KOMPC|nr:unnamed protein product [Komagataella phaffii CBS 7435]